MRESRGESALLEAALDLFAGKGYEGTSMRDLAREAGMSPPNLYNYTTSKEDLLWRVMSDTMEQLLAGFTAYTTGRGCSVARAVAAVRNHIEYHATHRREAIIGNGQIHFLSPDRQVAVKEFRRQYENGLREVVEKGVAEGVFTVENPKLASFAILQMGIAVSGWFRNDGRLTVPDVADVYAGFALRLLAVDHARHDQICADGEACLSRTNSTGVETIESLTEGAAR
ncbi:TetR/AcrR family transcriptional regulator [Blastococcus sp. SYSU DS0973]